jgi:spore coat polysaccharide biosynthesis protein SpsF
MDGIFITARLKSTRLPMKALVDVGGRPLLAYQIERLRAVCDIPLVICTSNHPQDDPLEAFAKEMGCLCFRGSEEDVLDRYLQCANQYDVDRLYITYADEPFADAGLLRKTIAQLDPAEKIWVRNDAYPDGVFGYGFTRAALTLVNKMKSAEANEVWGEMVSRLPITIVRNTPDYSANKIAYRLTVDYPEDLTAMRRLMGVLGDDYRTISIPDLLQRYEVLGLYSVNGFRSADYQQRLLDQAVK